MNSQHWELTFDNNQDLCLEGFLLAEWFYRDTNGQCTGGYGPDEEDPLDERIQAPQWPLEALSCLRGVLELVKG